MKINLIPTNEYYQEIISCIDEKRRNDVYLSLFVQPWQQMMDMMAAQFDSNSEDVLTGPRIWGWLLPNQVDQISTLLQTMEKADAWNVARIALDKACARFEPFAEKIPFDDITGWLVLADAARSTSMELGYSGATDWFNPRFVCQYWEPSPENLQRLGGIVSHEMHHLIRNRIFPFGPQTSVADYIIVEGTAEVFATSIFGEENLGLYISNIKEADLQIARQLIGKALSDTGFDVIRGYIFGDEIAQKSGAKVVGGMPVFGGYGVGYNVVQAYLQRSGKTIEEATFVPSMEIIEQSRYFR
ncbi:MAG: hypothetical protein JEZ00_18270 [Anaerolineaceae bacterium]|nr:hypothetical protein [Anaerolineaceae bacterium]